MKYKVEDTNEANFCFTWWGPVAIGIPEGEEISKDNPPPPQDLTFHAYRTLEMAGEGAPIRSLEPSLCGRRPQEALLEHPTDVGGMADKKRCEACDASMDALSDAAMRFHAETAARAQAEAQAAKVRLDAEKAAHDAGA